jgi:uncharacterized RDD family membrane protein YckC
MISMRKYILKSPLRTARLSRIIAKSIDMFIVLLLSLFFYPLGVIPALAYLMVCDSLQEGQSIGKKLMGFKVLSLEDGTPCTMKQSAVRNLPFAVPVFFLIIPVWGWIFCSVLAIPLTILELYLLVKLDSGKRLGDVMADTTVIGNDHQRADARKAKKGWFDGQTSAGL